MQDLLSDITLDVQQLGYLLRSLEDNPNDELKEVVLRTVSRVQGNLERLTVEIAEKHGTDVAEPVMKEACNSSVSQDDFQVEPTVTDSVSPENHADSEAVDIPEAEIVSEQAADPVLVECHEAAVEEDVPMSDGRFDKAETKTIGDKVCRTVSLKSMLSLNDLFRFSRELFGGEQQRLYAALDSIAHTASLNEAESLLREMAEQGADEDVFAELLERVERYFNNI